MSARSAIARLNLQSLMAIHLGDTLRFLQCPTPSAMRWSEPVKDYARLLRSRLSEGDYVAVRGNGAAGLTPEQQRGPQDAIWYHTILPAWSTIVAQESVSGLPKAGVQKDLLTAVAERQRAAGRPVSLQHDEKSVNPGFVMHKGVRIGETDYAGLRTDGKPDLSERRAKVAAVGDQLRQHAAALKSACARRAAVADGKEAADAKVAAEDAKFRAELPATVTLLTSMREAALAARDDRELRLQKKAERAASNARKKLGEGKEAKNSKPIVVKMNHTQHEEMWSRAHKHAVTAIACINKCLEVLTHLANASVSIGTGFSRAAASWKRIVAREAAADRRAAAGLDEAKSPAAVAGSEVDDAAEDSDRDDSDDEIDQTQDKSERVILKGERKIDACTSKIGVTHRPRSFWR